MDNAMSDAVKILVPNIVLLVMWYVDKQNTKQKNKAETESIVTQQFDLLNTAKNQEIKRLDEKASRNESTISQLIQINELQQKENEECKYNSATLKLQVKRLNQIVDFHGYEWEKVYVLDDNIMVTHSFEKYFTEAHIQMAVFNEVDTFVADVNKHKPCVLIIDNWLGEVQAKDVIRRLTYTPEIILMSADLSVEAQFEGQKIRFFPKTENYIYKIAQAVIEYLSNKN
jgi:Rps23 Pro-64 3,4-dihydroxylase Tpa1-like proline 4-hydroxylase